MVIGVGISQKQSANMVPGHILGKAVLKMGVQELQQFIYTELGENPALALEEERLCPICGSVLTCGVCSACGSRSVTEGDNEKSSSEELPDDLWFTEGINDDSYYEPFACVAAPSSIQDHLKAQIRAHFRREDIPAAEFLVDCLDDDGYLREPLFDLASRFGLSVPQLEMILQQVQKLDPPGIGARSLQECLLIQLRQSDSDAVERCVAERIIMECWDSMSRMKLDRVAHRLQLSKDEVSDAISFIRQSLNPHPAGMFHDPWQTLAPRKEAKVTPDVVIRQSEAGPVVEVVDPLSGRITIDEMYAALYSEVSRNKNTYSEEDRVRVKECVQNARSLIEALEFRRTALRAVAEELFRCQQDFFLNGPEYLKPMTRKQLAQRLQLHESTVCRATDNKTIQLPSGEVIRFDVLFDSALPVKELVKKLAYERLDGRPLTDGEIAERLRAQGVQIARRTVAKYRDELRVLPQEYRAA